MRKTAVLCWLLLLTLAAGARLVSDVPVKKGPQLPALTLTGEAARPPVGYVDVPTGHWARGALDELSEVKILDPGTGRPFWGDDPVKKSQLAFFLSQIMEKLLLGESGELELADASLGYRNITPGHPAYRPVQKLIALGVIPPGFRQEVFNGDATVNRYQLVYMLFSPLEKLLAPTFTFAEADLAAGYADVPRKNFAYPAIQKLIKLGVLPGEGEFLGEKPASRYWMAYLSVRVLKYVYLKIKEQEYVAPVRPEYGFRTLLSSNLAGNFLYAGKGTSDLLDLTATQAVNLTVDRALNRYASAYLSLENQFAFGSAAATRLLGVGETYLALQNESWSLQLGRTTNYFSYSPFGSSLFFDSRADMITAGFTGHPWRFSCSAGKLLYYGDVTADSNFASLLMTAGLGPLVEVAVGGNYVNKPLDPTGTAQLPTRIQQPYGGLKVSLSNFELALESANANFTNPDVLPFVGASDEVDTAGYQASLTYYSQEYNYSLSVGFQHLGDDFYNAGLATPALATGSARGRDAFLIKSRAVLSEEESLTTNAAIIYQRGTQVAMGVGLLYASRLFEQAYLNLGINGTLDPSFLNRFNSLSGTASLALSF